MLKSFLVTLCVVLPMKLPSYLHLKSKQGSSRLLKIIHLSSFFEELVRGMDDYAHQQSILDDRGGCTMPKLKF